MYNTDSFWLSWKISAPTRSPSSVKKKNGFVEVLVNE